MNKRGMASESATSYAASAILIIGLIIVAYVVLLPKEAREDVLKGKEIDFGDFDENGDDKDKDDGRDKTILLRNPGRLIPSGEEDVIKKFASVNLFETSTKTSKKLADRVFVSRTIFSNNFEELDFTLDNLENLERLSLFFNIKKAKGNIVIELNGKTVFKGHLDSSDVPIELPVINLKERNTLKISGAEIGAAFLSKNEFELRDLELIMEFSRLNKAELRSFEVSRAEAVEDARLDFFINCIEIGSDQGTLRVSLNRRLIFLGIIVCDASQSKTDIDEDLFVDGTNRLTFEVDKGNYIVEEIELRYDFNEGISPLYFFTINEDDFEDIVDGDDVNLILRFDNTDDRKRADVRVNDETLFVDVNTGLYEKEVTKFIREGENFVKIFPRNEFNLVQLEIRLERD